MLLSLSQWLQAYSPEFGFMRVFQYITFRAVMAAIVVAVMAAAIVVRAAKAVAVKAVVTGARAVKAATATTTALRLSSPRLS